MTARSGMAKTKITFMQINPKLLLSTKLLKKNLFSRISYD